MTIALWILNILLTVAFLGAGLSKLARPREALAAGGMGWAGDFSTPAVKAIGALEVIGAAGVILPFLTGIAPVLSPLAAVGLALLMGGAVVVHGRRHENATPAIALGVLAVAAAVVGFSAL